MSGEVFEYFFSAEELGIDAADVDAQAVANKCSRTTGLSQKMRADSSLAVAKRSEVLPNRDQPTGDDSAADLTSASPASKAKARVVEKGSESPAKESVAQEPESASTAEAEVAAALAPPELVSVAPVTTYARVRRLLSVHALGQYVYCARSAILAAERGDEHDIDEPPPRLTFLPNFSLEQIEERLSIALRTLAACAASLVALMAVLVYSQWAPAEELFWPALVLLVASLWWMSNVLEETFRLVWRRRAAIQAEARQPDFSVTDVEPVNWWSLLKTGLEPVNYGRPFRHPELPLEGCPWRVLERDSLRIPVIRTGGKRLGHRKGDPYRKHTIRLAAYAILLETIGHTEAPYGVVMPVDSPRGIAVAITDALRKQAKQLLMELELKLQQSQADRVDPRMPEQGAKCRQCDYGRPEPIEPRKIEATRKSGAALLVLEHPTVGKYHCVCGDRFGNAPPHEKSIRMKLRATVENC